MIRYAFDQTWVKQEIAKIDKNWLKKAAKRTEKMITQGRFEETSSIWSSIKPVYMILQKNKCVFCERQFESPDTGKIENDVEHFRPKGNVAAWPVATQHPFHYDFSTGEKFEGGYYWLAYNLHNYAASCKVCNTIYKKAFFPIAANRPTLLAGGEAPPMPAVLASEKPLLCYPLGEIDDDPEDLITFIGTTAKPVHAAGDKYQRGKVIIDFFGLNEREQLHKERARMISIFGPAFEKKMAGLANANDLMVLETITASHLPHSACLKAFARLWASDAVSAKQIFEQCRILATKF